eukprot:GEMP01032639.1.p1 GENE.GEMP01032639.1~~GEMP01032639.1.p1  ORF type:complete len:699 (+),score=144.33 GEMP01032639.1:23-2119(+)
MAAAARMLEPILGTWDRAGAFQYLQRFHRFAEVCGCDTPTNRTEVKNAVLFATMDLDLDAFIAKQNVSIHALESLSRMECPVMEPDKSMQRVNESMAKRIIFASKRLRMHFSLTETITCRGCIKRKRCKWFRKLAEAEPRANVVDVTKVLFGLSQYCRYFLQSPEVYPPIAQDLSSPLELVEKLEAFVQDNQRCNYADIPIADQTTATRLLIDRAKKHLAISQKKREERLLSLPEWMRKSLVLTDNPKNLSNRQKQELLAQSDAKDNPSDWVKEGEEKNIKDAELTEIDDVRSIPLPKRFEFIEKPEDRQAVEQYSTVYKQYVTGVYRTKDATELNLDEVPEPVSTETKDMGGGYTIVDMLDPRNFESIPPEALDAIQVAPTALSGVHYYNTTSRIGQSSALFDKKVIQDMWASSSNFDPPFLRRIPFDAPRQRSGGSLPPSVVHALGEAYKQSRTPSSSSTTPVDPRLAVEDDLDATPPKERVQVGPVFGRFTKQSEFPKQDSVNNQEDDGDSEPQRIFDDPWADVPPRRKNAPATEDSFGNLPRHEHLQQEEELIDLPLRRSRDDNPFGDTQKRSKSLPPKEEILPRKIPRGSYDSLRRGLNDPAPKQKNFEFSRNAKGRGGLYFPGEELPKKKTDRVPGAESSSSFPEVPKARSRLRQAKLGSTRGLVREKEDESDSPVALQRMINKKLRERVTN